MMALSLTVAGLGVVLLAAPARAQSAGNLADISLEDLLSMEVTSVSKKEEALFRAPSAIAVLTQDDIRRAGVSSIPDALRLIPGVQVASIDGNRWAVSARGFNSLYSNKLLVLIDGRSVYNITYSGVHWDMQDLPLEDIDRIEVIRGPGAALWGANAVNGVINIITRPARLTQGASVSVSAGSLDRGSFSGRYGGVVGGGSHFRVSTKFINRGQTVENGYGAPNDEWRTGRVHVRLDSQLSATDALLVSGGYARGEIGQSRLQLTGVMPWEVRPLLMPIETAESHALMKWSRALSPVSSLSLQVSVDDVSRLETLIGNETTVANADFQHRFGLGRHDLVWGIGQRVTWDRAHATFAFAMAKDTERIGLTNLFVQDDITLVPGRVQVTVGIKVEHSTVSGANVQPNLRVAFTPTTTQTVWGALSRAVRTASRNERLMTYRYLALPTDTLPLVFSMQGNPDVPSERLTAYELGYRVQPWPRVQLDATGFLNRYDDFTHFDPLLGFTTDGGVPHLTHALLYAAGGQASAVGAEVLARLQAARRWTLEGALSGLRTSFAREAVVPYPLNAYSPTHQWRVASRLTLPADVEADATVFRVGALESGLVPSYTRVDARLGWTVQALQVSLIGQNLFDGRHVEFDQIYGLQGSRLPRSASASVTWSF